MLKNKVKIYKNKAKLCNFYNFALFLSLNKYFYDNIKQLLSKFLIDFYKKYKSIFITILNILLNVGNRLFIYYLN